MTYDHDGLEEVVEGEAYPVKGSVWHLDSVAAEPFHGLGMLGHKQHTMVEVVGEAEASSSLGVRTRLVDTHSHMGCTVVEGMAVGKGIHMVVVDGSGHACCIQGWHCCRLWQSSGPSYRAMGPLFYRRSPASARQTKNAESLQL
jgi:hypothetical protein